MEALQSALNQTHRELEVIVVDDASTDSTWQILGSLEDPRLCRLRNEQNLGEGLSRNLAMASARGDWVAMLDADDAWESNRVERLLRLLRHVDEPVMLADNIMHCYSVDVAMQRWKRQWNRNQIGFTNGYALLNTADYLSLTPLLLKPLIPREHLMNTGILHSKRIFGADTEFHVRVLKSGLRLLMAEEPLYLYRRATGSMSSNPRRSAIMREMFVQLLQELDFSEREAAMIRKQILRLERDERYMPLLTDLRAGNRLQAALRGIRDVRLIGEFLRRLPASISYRTHVWLHRGDAR